MKVPKLLFPGFFLAIVILVGYGFYNKKEEKKAIFSINYHVDKELYVLNSTWFFNKPRISVSLVQLEDEDIRFFKNPPTDFFYNYPQLPSLSYKKWNIVKWKQTPYIKIDSQYVKIALDINKNAFFLDNDALSDVMKALNFVNNIVSEKGNYYAILYKIRDNNYSVDLFVVSPKRKLLVEINRR